MSAEFRLHYRSHVGEQGRGAWYARLKPSARSKKTLTFATISAEQGIRTWYAANLRAGVTAGDSYTDVGSYRQGRCCGGSD